MHHMKKVSVRDLRYHFSEVERLLDDGEEIEITKGKRAIARLLPLASRTPRRRPDFLARLRSNLRRKGSQGERCRSADA